MTKMCKTIAQLKDQKQAKENLQNNNEIITTTITATWQHHQQKK